MLTPVDFAKPKNTDKPKYARMRFDQVDDMPAPSTLQHPPDVLVKYAEVFEKMPGLKYIKKDSGFIPCGGIKI